MFEHLTRTCKNIRAMNQEKKNAKVTILFYSISLLIIVLINISGKFESQEQIINIDVSSIFLLVILNLVLLIINGIKAFILEKQTKLSFVIHLIALAFLIAYFNS